MQSGFASYSVASAFTKGITILQCFLVLILVTYFFLFAFRHRLHLRKWSKSIDSCFTAWNKVDKKQQRGRKAARKAELVSRAEVAAASSASAHAPKSNQHYYDSMDRLEQLVVLDQVA